MLLASYGRTLLENDKAVFLFNFIISKSKVLMEFLIKPENVDYQEITRNLSLSKSLDR